MGRNKFWTEEKLSELEGMATKVPFESIAEHFNVTPKTIQRLASIYGISLSFHKRSWTEKDNDYILKNAGKVSRKDIAKFLKRSVNSLSYHACYNLNVSLRLKRIRK